MKHIIYSFIESLIRNIGGGIGRRIRYQYYKRRLGGCGKNIIIDIGVIIENPQYVFLGNNIWIDNYVLIIAGFQGQNERVKIKPNYIFKGKLGELIISDHVHIAPYCVLQAHGGISIGSKSGVASGAKVYSLSHHYRNLNNFLDDNEYYFTPMVSIEEQFFVASPVVIGNGAAIGLNSVVLPGSIIPDNTWIGVSTYTSGEYEEGAIYSTEPSKFNKYKKK